MTDLTTLTKTLSSQRSKNYSRSGFGGEYYYEAVMNVLTFIVLGWFTPKVFLLTLSSHTEVWLKVLFMILLIILSAILYVTFSEFIKFILDYLSSTISTRMTIKKKVFYIIPPLSGRKIDGLLLRLLGLSVFRGSFYAVENNIEFHVDEEPFTAFAEGDVVEVTYTPHLHYVLSIRLVD